MTEPIHPDLLNQGESKRSRVLAMFAEIPDGYDRLNRIMSLRQDQTWRRAAVASLGLRVGDFALDLCCGTGDFNPLLREKVGPSGTVLGLDFCAPMLAKAVEKFPDQAFGIADALAIPLQANAVNGISVGWGIRNLADYDAAHREIFRVLKPGGRFASLDMAVPKNRFTAGLSRWGLGLALPVLGRMLGTKSAYTYLPQSALAFWSRAQLADSMARAGFINIKTQDFMLGNICLHTGEKP